MPAHILDHVCRRVHIDAQPRAVGGNALEGHNPSGQGVERQPQTLPQRLRRPMEVEQDAMLVFICNMVTTVGAEWTSRIFAP
jgi:hypothetical protein